jgi:hypothetical protein
MHKGMPHFNVNFHILVTWIMIPYSFQADQGDIFPQNIGRNSKAESHVTFWPKKPKGRNIKILSFVAVTNLVVIFVFVDAAVAAPVIVVSGGGGYRLRYTLHDCPLSGYGLGRGYTAMLYFPTFPLTTMPRGPVHIYIRFGIKSTVELECNDRGMATHRA